MTMAKYPGCDYSPNHTCSEEAIAKYLRFSADDGEVGDSESIKNQRDLLDSYISEHEELQTCTVIEFLDDGYTGTNFERPGFIDMMEAIKEQKITCIIVKDFSRFGRDYIQVSDYLDQIFPFLGIRFIAVNEQYDSKTAIASLSLDMAMKNLIYDFYSRDLSAKVRSAYKSMMKRGDYIAPYALYGYTKDTGKKQLVVDPPAAEVVKRIFAYAASGEKAKDIAIRLNKEGILIPNEYHKSKSTQKKQHYLSFDTAPLWYTDIVRRIIQDERYTGKMVCGKTNKVKGKAVKVPKKDWIITPNTHEGLVSEELFGKAQAIFRTRKKIIRPDKPRSILVGMFKCVHCNRNLIFKSLQKGSFFYCKSTLGLGCEQIRLEEQTLIDTIFTAIKAKLALVQASEYTVMTEQQTKADKRETEKRRLETKLKKLKLLQATILEQFLEGQLSKEKYQKQKVQIASDMQETADQLAALDVQSENASELVECHRPFYGQETLTREMVQALIKEIRVTSADEIEIVWKFQDCYNELQLEFMP